MNTKPWWASLVEVTCVCAITIAVLLAMASTPSQDEFTKGALAGLVSFVFSRFSVKV